MARIVVVTTQYPGLTKAGGIGNVTSRFVTQMIKEGHKIHVLAGRTQKPMNSEAIHFAQRQGASLQFIRYDESSVSPWWLSYQHKVQTELERHAPDLVISQEWQGPLALYAHKYEEKLRTITWLHGGGLYDEFGSNQYTRSIPKLIDMSLEEIQIHHSSEVISPTQYLLDFYKRFDWRLTNPKIIPYHLPTFEKFPQKNLSSDVVIAFVGALSKRKGFDLAIDTVRELHSLGLKFQFRIYGGILDFPRDTIIKLLEESGCNFEFMDNMSGNSIWQELSTLNTTLIVPSRLDNSPSVIYEAIAANCKVVVSDTQGGGELRSSFPNHIAKFSELSSWELKEFISAPRLSPGNLSAFNDSVTQMWNEVIKANSNSGFSPSRNVQLIEKEEITVVVITKDRPNFLEQALRSITSQTHQPTKVIVVEDVTNSCIGENLWKSFEQLGHNFQRISVDYSGTKFQPSTGVLLSGQNKAAISRNIGLRQVETKYVAFLDDDNLFKPEHLEIGLKKILEQSVDVVSTYMESVTSKLPLAYGRRSEQTIIMAGDQFGLLNWLSNITLDSQIISKTDTLIKLGGFPEETTPEDWGLGLKLMNAGVRVGCTRIPTVVYRKNIDGIQAKLVADSNDWHRLDSQSPRLSNNLGPTWWITRLIGASPGTNSNESQFENLRRMKVRTLLKIGAKAALKGEFQFLVHGMKKALRTYLRSN